jgi:hypothetical protein
MRYLKSHPIHENDSLSDMTVIKTKADATIVPQERESDGNEFQRLSKASKVKTDVESTYKLTGQGFQKLSAAADMEVKPSKETPKTDGSYQRLGKKPEVSSPDVVTKIHNRPDAGDHFQRLSDAPEKDNVSSTYKQNDSELNQRLSDIAASESRISRFSKFK